MPKYEAKPTIIIGRQTSCLAKGTPVWTDRGLVPIEAIQPGDLVLAQHPDTGELAFKAVIQTTVRPPKPLVRVDLGREELTTTGGHLFWVSGEGWMKAEDLRSGMQLHTPSGTVPVRGVEPAETGETYNLVVTDFNSYFVGRHRVLSHDVTEPRPTAAIVPGLVSADR